MSRRIELNPGEMFMVADRTILVDERESVLADMAKIGAPGHQIAYLFTFTGRVNNTTESESVTVAMSTVDVELLAKATRGDEG